MHLRQLLIIVQVESGSFAKLGLHKVGFRRPKNEWRQMEQVGVEKSVETK